VSLHDGFSGSERQVVSVGEEHLGAGFAELCGEQSLDGADGADRHEGGRQHRTMGGLELTGATCGPVVNCVKVKGERGH
jgi:hypothetical protein